MLEALAFHLPSSNLIMASSFCKFGHALRRLLARTPLQSQSRNPLEQCTYVRYLKQPAPLNAGGIYRKEFSQAESSFKECRIYQSLTLRHTRRMIVTSLGLFWLVGLAFSNGSKLLTFESKLLGDVFLWCVLGRRGGVPRMQRRTSLLLGPQKSM